MRCPGFGARFHLFLVFYLFKIMPSLLNVRSLVLAFGLPVAVWAQAPAPDTSHGTADQRIERLTTEDRASRIEELREGGQTRRITVQPKGDGLPAYDVAPSTTEHGSGANASGQGNKGVRTWRAFEF